MLHQNVIVGMAQLATRIFHLLPGKLRQRLKQAAGAAGHAPGWAQEMRARKLAAGVKRLDQAAADFGHQVAYSGLSSLNGLRCMEFGAGHLLSEAFSFHLAGAREVVATDYFPILQERHLPLVLEGADDDRIVKELARFADPDAIRRRLAALRRRDNFSLKALNDIGLSYAAPYDATQGPLERDGFDLITSRSVLEHVPRSGAELILRSVYASLRPGGMMVHSIHLDDHRDIERAPYAFLAADSDWSLAEEDQRGNRLRASDWVKLAQRIEAAEVSADPRPGDPSALPRQLAQEFAQHDRDDLAAHGVMLVVRKPGLRAS